MVGGGAARLRGPGHVRRGRPAAVAAGASLTKARVGVQSGRDVVRPCSGRSWCFPSQDVGYNRDKGAESASGPGLSGPPLGNGAVCTSNGMPTRPKQTAAAVRTARVVCTPASGRHWCRNNVFVFSACAAREWFQGLKSSCPPVTSHMQWSTCPVCARSGQTEKGVLAAAAESFHAQWRAMRFHRTHAMSRCACIKACCCVAPMPQTPSRTCSTLLRGTHHGPFCRHRDCNSATPGDAQVGLLRDRLPAAEVEYAIEDALLQAGHAGETSDPQASLRTLDLSLDRTPVLMLNPALTGP